MKYIFSLISCLASLPLLAQETNLLDTTFTPIETAEIVEQANIPEENPAFPESLYGAKGGNVQVEAFGVFLPEETAPTTKFHAQVHKDALLSDEYVTIGLSTAPPTFDPRKNTQSPYGGAHQYFRANKYANNSGYDDKFSPAPKSAASMVETKVHQKPPQNKAAGK